MSTTVMNIRGEVRETEVSIESFDKHRDVIIAYCNGADVERSAMDRPWKPSSDPSFRVDCAYRIAQRKPQPGEVWVCRGGNPWIWAEDPQFTGWVELRGKDVDDNTSLGSLKYAAPSVKAYYAREFLKAIDGKRGEDWDTLNKLETALETAADLEPSK